MENGDTLYFGNNIEIGITAKVIDHIKLYISSNTEFKNILDIYDAITGYMSNDTLKEIEEITDDDLVPLYSYMIFNKLKDYYPCLGLSNINANEFSWRRIYATNIDIYCESNTIFITVKYTDSFNKAPKASVAYKAMVSDRVKISTIVLENSIRKGIKNSTYGAQIDEYCKNDEKAVNEAFCKMHAEKYLTEIIGKKLNEYYINDGIEYTFNINAKDINAAFGVPTFSAFDAITDELKDTYIKKNHDYGNSFDKSIDKFGLTAAVVRMSDKMERLSSLINKDAEVNESIRDTVMDLANYCIMTAMYLDNKKEKK